MWLTLLFVAPKLILILYNRIYLKKWRVLAIQHAYGRKAESFTSLVCEISCFRNRCFHLELVAVLMTCGLKTDLERRHFNVICRYQVFPLIELSTCRRTYFKVLMNSCRTSVGEPCWVFQNYKQDILILYSHEWFISRRVDSLIIRSNGIANFTCYNK